MFWFVKQVFTALLSFCGSLTTKCVSINNEKCMTRPILIDLNPVELSHYPFMISLDKCNGSCNAVDDLSSKICLPRETKGVDVKVFNMTARINEAKTLVNNISCDYKCKFHNATCNSNQKWNDICQCECKKY